MLCTEEKYKEERRMGIDEKAKQEIAGKTWSIGALYE